MIWEWCSETGLTRPFSLSSRRAARASEPLILSRSTSADGVMSLLCGSEKVEGRW